MKVNNNILKTTETIIKRLIIIVFIGVLMESANIVFSSAGVSKGERLGILVAIMISVMSFSLMLIKEMSKSS